MSPSSTIFPWNPRAFRVGAPFPALWLAGTGRQRQAPGQRPGARDHVVGLRRVELRAEAQDAPDGMSGCHLKGGSPSFKVSNPLYEV